MGNPETPPHQDNLQNPTPPEKERASLVYRYAAFMLDGLIVGVAFIPLLIFFMILGYSEDDTLPNLFGTVISFIYSVILIKSHRATWGKSYFKLKVETMDGQSMTWGRALKREVLGKILSTLFLGLGYLWAIFNKKRRAWHDFVAGTMVVQSEPLSKGRKFVAYLLAFGLFILAILGVLAVVALVSINPSEQMKRARDAGRISGVQQLGRAVQSYYMQNSFYPGQVNWVTDIETSGVSELPAAIKYDSRIKPCSTNVANDTWCYNTNQKDAIVFARLESQNYDSKCTKASESAYAIFSTKEGRGGVICSAIDPITGGVYNFLQ